MTEPSKLLEVIFTNSYAEVPCAYIRHKDRVVALDTSKLLRGTDVALHRESFSYLNRFFFDLPAQQQDKVIAAYARAETILRTIDDMEVIGRLFDWKDQAHDSLWMPFAKPDDETEPQPAARPVRPTRVAKPAARPAPRRGALPDKRVR